MSCRPVCTAQTSPDLVADADRLTSDVVIERRDVVGQCALTEGCVGALGNRRLLRCGVEVENQGFASALPGTHDNAAATCGGEPKLHAINANSFTNNTTTVQRPSISHDPTRRRNERGNRCV